MPSDQGTEAVERRTDGRLRRTARLVRRPGLPPRARQRDVEHRTPAGQGLPQGLGEVDAAVHLDGDALERTRSASWATTHSPQATR